MALNSEEECEKLPNPNAKPPNELINLVNELQLSIMHLSAQHPACQEPCPRAGHPHVNLHNKDFDHLVRQCACRAQ